MTQPSGNLNGTSNLVKSTSKQINTTLDPDALWNEADNFKKLYAPFHDYEIEWRIQSSGMGTNGPWAKCLPYLTARAVQDRLDIVFGPANWRVSYEFLDKGVLCNLEILTTNGWVIKVDGSEFTDIESFKGGISSAFKRAAVLWGIGRYLYSLGECWATFQGITRDTPGALSAKIADKWHNWLPPKLPAWALPAEKK